MEAEPQEPPINEEQLLLIGLNEAVRAGRITEQEKQDWLNEYIDKRRAEMLFYPIVLEE